MPTNKTEKLTGPMIAALVVLMAEAREVSNPEMQELAGFTLTGSDRTNLEKWGYIKSWRTGRSYTHVLDDKGWSKVSQFGAADRPERSMSTVSALYVVLGGIARALRERGISHAEFFASSAALAVSASANSTDLQTAIRKAYANAYKGPEGWVALADIRGHLTEFSRDAVDAELRVMNRLPDIHLIAVANLKSLTPEQRAGAVRIGDDDQQAIRIDAP
jgi:hypothetical protein